MEADFDIPGRKLEREIIVVDNNSQDGMKEILRWQYPAVKFIQFQRNIGMGAGNNAGFKKALGDYIVVMNPDTLAFKDTFTKLWQYMERNQKVGLVGPKQLNPDKSVQDSCFRWHRLFTPLLRRTPLGKCKFAQKGLNCFKMSDYDRSYIKEVDWLLGSFMFIRRLALKQVEGFDERFFLYFEDTDFCKRFHKLNWQVVYNPEVQIIHNHNRDSAQVEWYKFYLNKTTRSHISSWIKYLLKWKLN